jgi:hypothetical protein
MTPMSSDPQANPQALMPPRRTRLTAFPNGVGFEAIA